MIKDPSEQDVLRRQVNELREHLAIEGELAPKTKDALHAVADDIHTLLAKDTTSQDWSDVGKRWNEALLDFEFKHPRLSILIEQVTTTLANVGI